MIQAYYAHFIPQGAGGATATIGSPVAIAVGVQTVTTTTGTVATVATPVAITVALQTATGALGATATIGSPVAVTVAVQTVEAFARWDLKYGTTPTNGDTVTTGNSNLTAIGGTPTWSTDQATPSGFTMAVKLNAAATVLAYNFITNDISGPIYARWYAYLPTGSHTSMGQLGRWASNDAGTEQSRLDVGVPTAGVSGGFRHALRNSAGSSNGSYTENEWTRFEMMANATTDTWELRMYSQAGTQTGTLTGSAAAFPALDSFAWGTGSAVAGAYYIADAAVDTAGWIGPASWPTTIASPVAIAVGVQTGAGTAGAITDAVIGSPVAIAVGVQTVTTTTGVTTTAATPVAVTVTPQTASGAVGAVTTVASPVAVTVALQAATATVSAVASVASPVAVTLTVQATSSSSGVATTIGQAISVAITVGAVTSSDGMMPTVYEPDSGRRSSSSVTGRRSASSVTGRRTDLTVEGRRTDNTVEGRRPSHQA